MVIKFLSIKRRREKEIRKMKVGDVVNIKACDSMPELVGCDAQVVDLQSQPHEKYRTYSIWAKLTSGKSKGKIYGFHDGELDIVTGTAPVKAVAAGVGQPVRATVIEQIDQLLSGVVTTSEINEIERRLSEARGRIPATGGKGFWEDKTPCWETFRCPEVIRNECPAYRFTSLPCWEIEGTYSKLSNFGEKGDKTDICQHCRIYKKYGDGKPIQIKLVGQGMNRAAQPVKK